MHVRRSCKADLALHLIVDLQLTREFESSPAKIPKVDHSLPGGSHVHYGESFGLITVCQLTFSIQCN